MDDYEDKRDLGETPEPEAGQIDDLEHPVFVIQEHDATSHHYDFRLEIDDTLVSWAVPKGPSTDPSEKRLAIRTEDHPVSYAAFEGVIPEDHYGAGPVLIWDRGTWSNITEKDGSTQPAAEALEAGHLLADIHGEKIRGGYVLQRIQEGDDEQWLLIKMDDDEADARRKPTSTEPESVATGRDIEQVAEEDEPEEPDV